MGEYLSGGGAGLPAGEGRRFPRMTTFLKKRKPRLDAAGHILETHTSI